MEQPSKKQKETEEGIYVGEFLERVARAREQMTNDFLEMRQRLEKIKDESIQLQAALDTQNRELDELEQRAAENQREQMKTNKMIDEFVKTAIVSYLHRQRLNTVLKGISGTEKYQ